MPTLPSRVEHHPVGWRGAFNPVHRLISDVRRIIYIVNIIEPISAELYREIRTNGHFRDEARNRPDGDKLITLAQEALAWLVRPQSPTKPRVERRRATWPAALPRFAAGYFLGSR